MLPRRTVLVAATAGVAGCATGPLLPVPQAADQPCPPRSLPEARVICSHTDAAGGIDLSATPSSVSTAPESLERVRLLVENGGDVPLTYDASGWRLYRNAGLGWKRREDVGGGPRGTETLPPGGSASWSGIDSLFRLGSAGRTPAGLYAAVLPVRPERGGDAGTIACVFLFSARRE